MRLTARASSDTFRILEKKPLKFIYLHSLCWLAGLPTTIGDGGGIPGQNLPLVCHIFRVDKHNTSKIEMIILNARHIFNGSDDARSMMNAFRTILGTRASEQLEDGAAPIAPAPPAKAR